MNLYGVLGRYIPAFGRVVGRMQYDCSTPTRSTPTSSSCCATCVAWRCRVSSTSCPRCHACSPRCSGRSWRTSPRCFTTSRRGAAATTPTRLGRCRGILPRAGTHALRLTAGVLARPQSPAVLGDGQKKDISDPKVIQDFARTGRRPDAPRLPVPADRRRRARHQPEALEFVEGVAVPRFLRARAPRPAPRHRVAGRSCRTRGRDQAKALECWRANTCSRNVPWRSGRA